MSFHVQQLILQSPHVKSYDRNNAFFEDTWDKHFESIYYLHNSLSYTEKINTVSPYHHNLDIHINYDHLV